MRSIDLNADLGEGFDHDSRLIPLISSANISTGVHAGDEATIRARVRECLEEHVQVGAHPGFADRAWMGRRGQFLTPRQLERLLTHQFERFQRLVSHERGVVSYLKLHGALYHQAFDNPELCQVVIGLAKEHHLPLLGPGYHDRARQIATRSEVVWMNEGFGDRRYDAKGQLLPRSHPDAILTDAKQIRDQVKWLVHESDLDSLCIHGDRPDAMLVLEVVRETLAKESITVKAWTNR